MESKANQKFTVLVSQSKNHPSSRGASLESALRNDRWPRNRNGNFRRNNVTDFPYQNKFAQENRHNQDQFHSEAINLYGPQDSDYNKNYQPRDSYHRNRLPRESHSSVGREGFENARVNKTYKREASFEIRRPDNNLSVYNHSRTGSYYQQLDLTSLNNEKNRPQPESLHSGFRRHNALASLHGKDQPIGLGLEQKGMVTRTPLTSNQQPSKLSKQFLAGEDRMDTSWFLEANHFNGSNSVSRAQPYDESLGTSRLEALHTDSLTTDLTAIIDRLQPFQEYELPDCEVFVDDLIISKPIYLVGSASTVLRVRGKISLSLERVYNDYQPSSRKMQGVFKQTSFSKGTREIISPSNKVVFFSVNILFEPQEPGAPKIGNEDLDKFAMQNEGDSHKSCLFHLSQRSSLTLSSCTIKGPLDLAPNEVLSVFSTSKVFQSAMTHQTATRHLFGDSAPETQSGLICLESCLFDQLDELYAEKACSHTLFMSRSQIIGFRRTVLGSLGNFHMAIENSTFSNCLSSPLRVYQAARSARNSGKHIFSPLNALKVFSKKLNFPSTTQPIVMPTTNSFSSAIENRQKEEKFLGETPKNSQKEQTDSIYLKNVTFIGNTGICICVESDLSRGQQGSYPIVAKDCLFEGNLNVCVQSNHNKKTTLFLNQCKFSSNRAVCIEQDSALLLKVVACKFEDNLNYLVTLKDSPFQFNKNVCYRNTQAVQVTTKGNKGVYFANISQNRIDKVDGNGVEIFTNGSLKLTAHINIILGCQNAIYIDSRSFAESRSPQSSSQNNSSIEFFDNDLCDSREHGLVILGSACAVNLRKDYLAKNGEGAILVEAEENREETLTMDDEEPPRISGLVAVNGQKRQVSTGDQCLLI